MKGGLCLVLAATTACSAHPGKPDPAAKPVARDAPAAADASISAAPVARAGAFAPVLVVGARRFVDVSLWFDLPALPKGTDVATWGDGDVESVQLGASPTARAPYVKVRPAPKAPPEWRAIAGGKVIGVSSSGATCEGTLGALSLLSHGPGLEIYQGYEGDQPIVLAQVTAACDPIVLDARANPAVFAAAGKPSTAQRAALVTAWRALAKSSAWDVDQLDKPAIEVFAANGRSFALVVVEATRPLPGNCGQTYVGARAIYELGPTPTLRGATDTAFGDAKTLALIAHEHDISAVLGAATFDHGGSGTIEYGSLLTFADGTSEIAHSTSSSYIGCD